MIKIIIIIFTVLLGIVVILGIWTRHKKPIPTPKNSIPNTTGDGDKGKNIKFVRDHLGLPILYTILFGILMHIDIIARIIKSYPLLAVMLLIAMVSPSILLECRQSKEEKLKDQKRLDSHYTILVLFIFSLIGGMELGWIERTSPESKRVRAIMENQVSLALKPIENKLAVLETKAEKVLLSPSELLELERLQEQAKRVRIDYGLGQRDPFLFNGKEEGDKNEKQTKVSAPVRWQLCWEKIPAEHGKTDKRRDCTPARIIRKDNVLMAEYNLSGGGRGIISASKTNGAYEGTWSDKWGSGPIYLRFSSNTSSLGWVKDKKTGMTPATLATM